MAGRTRIWRYSKKRILARAKEDTTLWTAMKKKKKRLALKFFYSYEVNKIHKIITN